MKHLFAIALSCCLSSVALAHDTWVETNTTIVRPGDAVYVDLKLGNHGNHHRDFKLASKVALEKVTLQVVGPDGQATDLKDRLVDTGYAPKEGYWTAKSVAARPGLYVVVHTLDTLHKTTRAIKSAKTYFVASPSLDAVTAPAGGFDKPLGHALELVPLTDPLALAGPGHPLRVRLLFKGKPLPEATVTFIPRGHELAEGFDDTFERKTDADGTASFTPDAGNRYLVVVHHAAPDEKGDDYDATAYTATLTVLVPEQAVTATR